MSALTDILHRIIHSSAAAETERIALHEAVGGLESAENKATEKDATPEVTEAKEGE